MRCGFAAITTVVVTTLVTAPAVAQPHHYSIEQGNEAFLRLQLQQLQGRLAELQLESERLRSELSTQQTDAVLQHTRDMLNCK
jgi:hypothetical protein